MVAMLISIPVAIAIVLIAGIESFLGGVLVGGVCQLLATALMLSRE
jgi:hypothetical protein